MYKAIVVDDEEIFRKNLIRKINWEAYNIQIAGEAKDGAEALSLSEEVEPHIIICDIKMPVMDGISLLKQLSNVQGKKFIILSGFNDFEFTSQAVKYGAFDYILKPINVDEISGVLMRAVELLDNSVARSNNNLLSNLELRKIMVENYESLIIHCMESRDISSIDRYIDDFYANLDLKQYPEIYENSYNEFVLLAGKICRMFKLDTKGLLKNTNIPTGLCPSYSQKPVISDRVKQLFRSMVEELLCSKNSEGKKIINMVLEYIEKNYAQKISLEIISKRYFINPSYFSQLFKSTTNENFSAYLIGKRVEKARELLNLKTFKIYQIAEMVGYEDEKHFSQIFKKYTGFSPSEYI